MTLGIPTRNHSFSNNFPKLSTPVRQGGVGMFRLGHREWCNNQEAQDHGRRHMMLCVSIEKDGLIRELRHYKDRKLGRNTQPSTVNLLPTHLFEEGLRNSKSFGQQRRSSGEPVTRHLCNAEAATARHSALHKTGITGSMWWLHGKPLQVLLPLLHTRKSESSRPWELDGTGCPGSKGRGLG